MAFSFKRFLKAAINPLTSLKTVKGMNQRLIKGGARSLIDPTAGFRGMAGGLQDVANEVNGRSPGGQPTAAGNTAQAIEGLNDASQAFQGLQGGSSGAGIPGMPPGGGRPQIQFGDMTSLGGGGTFKPMQGFGGGMRRRPSMSFGGGMGSFGGGGGMDEGLRKIIQDYYAKQRGGGGGGGGEAVGGGGGFA